MHVSRAYRGLTWAGGAVLEVLPMCEAFSGHSRTIRLQTFVEVVAFITRGGTLYC